MAAAQEDDMPAVLRARMEQRRAALRETLGATTSADDTDWGTGTLPAAPAAAPAPATAAPAPAPAPAPAATPSAPSAAQRLRRLRAGSAEPPPAAQTDAAAEPATPPARVLQRRTSFSLREALSDAGTPAPAAESPGRLQRLRERRPSGSTRAGLQRRTSFSLRQQTPTSPTAPAAAAADDTGLAEPIERRLRNRRRQNDRATRFDNSTALPAGQPAAAAATPAAAPDAPEQAAPAAAAAAPGSVRSLRARRRSSELLQAQGTTLDSADQPATAPPGRMRAARVSLANISGIPMSPIPLGTLAAPRRMSQSAAPARPRSFHADVTVSADDFFAGTSFATPPQALPTPAPAQGPSALPAVPEEGAAPAAEPEIVPAAPAAPAAAAVAPAAAAVPADGDDDGDDDFLAEVIPGGGIWSQMTSLKPGETVYTPKLQQLDREAKIYRWVEELPVPLASKLPPGQDPYFKDDEGLYVGVPPSVSNRRLHRMEHRVLAPEAVAQQQQPPQQPSQQQPPQQQPAEAGAAVPPSARSAWFGEDGQLVRAADPVSDLLLRGPMCGDPEPVPPELCEHRPATLGTIDQPAAPTGALTFHLDVELASVHFVSHPLFTTEHVLAFELADLYTQYRERSERNLGEYLTERLLALKAAVSRLEQSLPAAGAPASAADVDFIRQDRQRLHEYRHEIKQVRCARDEEERALFLLVHSIVDRWNKLKDVRAAQGYTSTPHTIVVFQQQVL